MYRSKLPTRKNTKRRHDMPCQSYDNSWRDHSSDERKIRELKAQADKLARIACKALQALEDMKQEDFLLLRDDEVAKWWKEHKIADAAARVAEEVKRARLEAKKQALAKLTDEEKVLLGLKKK